MSDDHERYEGTALHRFSKRPLKVSRTVDCEGRWMHHCTHVEFAVEAQPADRVAGLCRRNALLGALHMNPFVSAAAQRRRGWS